MKCIRPLTVLLTALLFSSARVPSASAADDGRMRETPREVVGPHRGMLRSGVWTLGIGYVPAAVVAIESSLPADNHLYIPVAGPWLDYAERDCETCEHERLNKALLVTDGVVQGLGALQILGSFLFLETRTVSAPAQRSRKVASKPGFRLIPAKLGSAYGLAATTRF